MAVSIKSNARHNEYTTDSQNCWKCDECDFIMNFAFFVMTMIVEIRWKWVWEEILSGHLNLANSTIMALESACVDFTLQI